MALERFDPKSSVTAPIPQQPEGIRLDSNTASTDVPFFELDKSAQPSTSNPATVEKKSRSLFSCGFTIYTPPSQTSAAMNNMDQDISNDMKAKCHLY